MCTRRGLLTPSIFVLLGRDNHTEFVLTTANPFVIPNLITRTLRNKPLRREMDPTMRLTLVGIEKISRVETGESHGRG